MLFDLAPNIYICVLNYEITFVAYCISTYFENMNYSECLLRNHGYF